MFQRILVPLDGSDQARCAIPIASRIARATGGTVVLLRTVSLPFEASSSLAPSLPSASSQTMIEVSKAEARRYLQGVAASSDLHDIQTESEICLGPVAPTILDLASSRHIDLIVLSRHGQSGTTRWALGSVADKVVHDSSIPILLLPCAQKISLLQAKPSLRAIIPLDGSLHSESAIEPAAHLIAALSEPSRGTLSLAQVIPFPSILPPDNSRESQRISYVKEQATREVQACLGILVNRLAQGITSRLKLTVTGSSLCGRDVAEALLEETEQNELVDGQITSMYDLLVMTTHGRGGLHHRMMGSISNRMLHTTSLPLMIVPSTGTNHHTQAHQERSQAKTSQDRDHEPIGASAHQ